MVKKRIFGVEISRSPFGIHCYFKTDFKCNLQWIPGYQTASDSQTESLSKINTTEKINAAKMIQALHFEMSTRDPWCAAHRPAPRPGRKGPYGHGLWGPGM